MPGQTKRKGEDKVGAGGNKSQNRDMKHMAVQQGEKWGREKLGGGGDALLCEIRGDVI